MSKPEIYPIPPEKMAEYRATAQRRAERDRQRLLERFQLGQQIAARGAALLKERYSADRVVAFGSLIDERLFHVRSDVDLAAWGIDERAYLRALADLLALSSEFEVDLVRMEEAQPSLCAVIERTGQDL